MARMNLAGLVAIALAISAGSALAYKPPPGGGGCAAGAACLPGQITINGATGTTNPGDVNINGSFKVNGVPVTGTGTVTSVGETFTGGLIESLDRRSPGLEPWH